MTNPNAHRARGYLEKAGTKVGQLIGDHLPEPTEKNGAHALNGAIIGVVVITVLTLLVTGVISAIVQFVVMSVLLIVGMYAGIPAFRIGRARKVQPNDTTPPTV